MKNTWRILLLVLLLTGAASHTNAQNYRNGIGARLGYFNGLTFKHFFNSRGAGEFLLTSRWHGFIITGLYEYHIPISSVRGMAFYPGGGVHIGFWNDYDHWDKDRPDGNSFVGLDLILGLEYTFAQAPFTIALDWKPAFHVFGYSGWWGDGFALSARFNF